MNSPNIAKMEPLLSFPHNAFLMLRLEYAQILQDDLQAKLLRIIEAHIETQRQVLYRDRMNKQKGDSQQPIEIPKDIFVPISYRLFMNDLFDLVTSENTIKKALNQMISYKIIFRKEAPKKRYAAPEYSINTTALQLLLDALKNPGYQILIPSIIDALKNSYPQDLIPSWYQDLIPSISKSSSEEKSRVSRFDTNIRESNITDKNECSPNEKSQGDALSHSSTPSLSSEEKVSTPETPTPTNAPASTPSESDEVKRVQGYWKRLGLIVRKSEHWATLSEHIHSFEEMDSLFKYTQASIICNPRAPEKTVHPGNLVNCLNGWKQEQMALQTKSKAAEGPKVMTALEKVKSYEETYSKAPPPVSPLELFKQKQKQARLSERKA